MTTITSANGKTVRQVCEEIAADMANDARDFDGKPFNGRTVAEYFGNQGAAIAALAKIIAWQEEERATTVTVDAGAIQADPRD